MSRKRARDPTSPTNETDNTNIGSAGSTSGQNEFTRFTEVIAELLKTTSRKPEATTVRGDVIPIFNPEDKSQEIEAWCSKVDELREVFGWTEEATIYFSLAKLRGLAETWFKGLQTVKLSWIEWKEKLKQAFPFRKDFCDTLSEMLRRRKRPDETYSKYFYEKCVLLSSCKIEGEDAVSCLIGGIDDNVVKTGARAGRHQTPESLHEFLNTVGNSNLTTSSYDRRFNKNFSKFSNRISQPPKKFKPERFETDPRRNDQSKACYKCGKMGHIAKSCQVKTCTYCRRSGHIESSCFQKQRDNPKPIA